MNRFNSFALSAASATFAYFAGVSRSRNVENYEKITPDSNYFRQSDYAESTRRETYSI